MVRSYLALACYKSRTKVACSLILVVEHEAREVYNVKEVEP